MQGRGPEGTLGIGAGGLGRGNKKVFAKKKRIWLKTSVTEKKSSLGAPKGENPLPKSVGERSGGEGKVKLQKGEEDTRWLRRKGGSLGGTKGGGGFL